MEHDDSSNITDPSVTNKGFQPPDVRAEAKTGGGRSAPPRDADPQPVTMVQTVMNGLMT